MPPERGAHREQELAGDVDAYPRGARHPTSFPERPREQDDILH